MTIGTEITRIKTNIENAYTALGEKGATMPEVQNSDNLAETVGSVSTGGGGESEDIPEGYYKTVFVDYDGTVLSEQLIPEGGSAIAPEVPEHQELTFTGWNREFTNISEHQLIGACYSIPSGMSIYVVDLTAEQLEQNFYFTYKNVTTDATTEGYIDWGDGTKDIISEFENSTGWHSLAVNHTYEKEDRYYIKCYYWQTLAGSTYYQGAGGLTKSLPTKADADALKAMINLNDNNNSIVPEEFQELKELYISPEFAYRMKDPFYAPNLEAIVFSDKRLSTLSGSNSNVSLSYYTSASVSHIRNLISNNKITHVTLPGEPWDTEWHFTHMPNLKTISYFMDFSLQLTISECNNITEFYNMLTFKNTYYTNCSIKFTNLYNLKRMYNAVENGSGIQGSQKLDKITLNCPVSLTKLNGLRYLDANFKSTDTPTIFRVDECPSLEVANINWAKVDLNTTYSNLPLFKSEYLTGVLDLSSSPALCIGETVTASSTSYSYYSPFNHLGCSKIILPPQLEVLNSGFTYLKDLRSIEFPSTLKVISMYNFAQECYELESIDFPLSASATSANCYTVYQNCYKLKNAIIPSGIKLSSSAIQGCPSLKKVWVSKDADLSKYTSSSYTLFGTSSNNKNMNVTIYTDATEKPSTWGSYWNYAGSSYGTDGYVDVVWGATEEQYKNA